MMKNGISVLFKSKFIKNTGWMVFAQIYQMLIQLIIGVISARYLGPSNYGTFSYGASYVSFFTIIAALGLEGIVVKEMVANRKEEATVLGSSILMRLVAGLLSMFAVYIIVRAVNPNDQILLTVTFLQSIALLFNAFNIIDTWYQSYLKSKVSTIIRCISYTVVSGYKVFLLITGKSVEWFAFSTSFDSILIAIMFLIAYKKHGGQRLKADFTQIKQLFIKSYHLVISYMMAVVYSQMDRIMIGRMIDQTHVGYYAAAATICNMWLFIPQAITNSARPIIMELKGKNEDLYITRIKQLNAAIFWIGVVFSVAISVMSTFIINILYGNNYIDAKGPLMLIIWSTVFSSLSYSRATWMICENKQNYAKNIMLWGVLINLTLNFILIPIVGINGAAIATLTTEIVTCLIAPYFYKDIRVFVRYVYEAMSPEVLLRMIKKKNDKLG